MQFDTFDRFSVRTIRLHWFIAVGMIGLVKMGAEISLTQVASALLHQRHDLRALVVRVLEVTHLHAALSQC